MAEYTTNDFLFRTDQIPTEELFEELEFIGCDGYYADVWSSILGELKSRLAESEKRLWKNSQ